MCTTCPLLYLTRATPTPSCTHKNASLCLTGLQGRDSCGESLYTGSALADGLWRLQDAYALRGHHWNTPTRWNLPPVHHSSPTKGAKTHVEFAIDAYVQVLNHAGEPTDLARLEVRGRDASLTAVSVVNWASDSPIPRTHRTPSDFNDPSVGERLTEDESLISLATPAG
ncbi:hypothetical protein BKA70DRAFT_1565204 [Coprinopsis sp. MPI-PUGE-AT-0042]|nr:hypothetical protein BKA70DRAFT_1565204 [Coprinopsis sp. MPI-PUGE-AT-0042]